jgi:hypothetical protein
MEWIQTQQRLLAPLAEQDGLTDRQLFQRIADVAGWSSTASNEHFQVHAYISAHLNACPRYHELRHRKKLTWNAFRSFVKHYQTCGVYHAPGHCVVAFVIEWDLCRSSNDQGKDKIALKQIAAGPLSPSMASDYETNALAIIAYLRESPCHLGTISLLTAFCSTGAKVDSKSGKKPSHFLSMPIVNSL